MASDAATTATEDQMPPTLSRGARYYRIHREERLEKNKARYASNPEVIAKREERERIRAEKEAAKEAAKAERERKRQEKIALAKQTSRVARYRAGSEAAEAEA